MIPRSRQTGSALVELPFAMLAIALFLLLLGTFTAIGLEAAAKIVRVDDAVKDQWERS